MPAAALMPVWDFSRGVGPYSKRRAPLTPEQIAKQAGVAKRCRESGAKRTVSALDPDVQGEAGPSPAQLTRQRVHRDARETLARLQDNYASMDLDEALSALVLADAGDPMAWVRYLMRLRREAEWRRK